ncbi:hypothetical protein BYT27DRAFT_7180962 [Phlegmacium glaucopus]|nr:hypothetical protein BYT27DRAFT_7180962 [Phlegmacium glaucopus]
MILRLAVEDPLHITLHQTFLHLLIRVGGVLGGVFVCMGYVIRITMRAVEVVSGADQAPCITAESSGVKVGLRAKWGGSESCARPRSRKLIPQFGWQWLGSWKAEALEYRLSCTKSTTSAPSTQVHQALQAFIIRQVHFDLYHPREVYRHQQALVLHLGLLDWGLVRQV